jgi:hypothetical protein
MHREIFQGGFLSPLFFSIATIQLTNKLNKADCGYPVHRTERKISHLLYMDDLKLLGRIDDLENEIKIVKAISKDVNMNFGVENCATVCLQIGGAHSKLCIGRTYEKDIKELDPREAYVYLDIEGSHDMKHEGEK